jgi:CheY-like chemotaxis protein
MMFISLRVNGDLTFLKGHFCSYDETVMTSNNRADQTVKISNDQSSLGSVLHWDQRIEGPGRILVMDDEEFILDVTGEVLLELGYEVELSRDGLEALEKYELAMKDGKRFDAVIMDLTVPRGMGGKEAVRLLLDIDPRAKALVSSGHSNDPVMADFRAHGFAGVVPKPYKIEQLSNILKGILKSDKGSYRNLARDQIHDRLSIDNNDDGEELPGIRVARAGSPI